MKKRFITSAIAIAALGFAAAPAFAGTTKGSSGTIELRGKVGLSCFVGVTDDGVGLDLVGGESGKQVGSVVEHCNNVNGYTVTITSKAGGALQGPLSTDVAYTVDYDTAAGRSLGDAGLTFDRDNPVYDVRHPVKVNIAGSNTLPAGDYADTLVIEIAAK